jgi:hypothetical protein
MDNPRRTYTEEFKPETPELAKTDEKSIPQIEKKKEMNELPASVLYRTCPGENRAPRPIWYSKEISIKSILLSFRVLKKEVSAEFTLYIDGYLKPHDEWSSMIKKMVESRGTILENPPKGNVETGITVLRQALDLPENRVLIFSEDDYLWLTPALLGIYRSLAELPVQYSTPYDHPVRYQPDYPQGADLPHWQKAIFLTKERHWRAQESTCMTFATTSHILSEDITIFEKHKDNGKGRPEDRELFRELQQLGPYEHNRIGKRRLLVGPMPSLATHAHLPWLAPVVDWEKEARLVHEQTVD